MSIEDAENQFKALCKIMENTADALAEASWKRFQAYQRAGFSEEQALELLKNQPVEANFG